MPFFSIFIIMLQMSSFILQCSIINLELGLSWLKFDHHYTVLKLSELVSAQVVAVKDENLIYKLGQARLGFVLLHLNLSSYRWKMRSTNCGLTLHHKCAVLKSRAGLLEGTFCCSL